MLADKGSTGGGLTDNNWSSLIGIVTAIVGNVLISIALNLQRYAHIRLRQKWDKNQDSKSTSKHTRDAKSSKGSSNGSKARNDSKDGRKPGETQPLLGNRSDSGDEQEGHPQGNVDNVPEKSYLRSPLWWAGQILMTVGEAGNFLAYGFAPASIVSPLGVVALISNCIIAPFFLKERFRKRDALGVIIAVGGAVTVALSASDNNPKLGPDELWGLIKRWEFLTYLGITCGAIIALMVVSNKYGHKSIFIDLGLVGLFGAYAFNYYNGVNFLRFNRRLHCPLHQRRGVSALLHDLQSTHLRHHLPSGRGSHIHCRHANQVLEPSSQTFQRHSSYSHAIRLLHTFRHSR